MKIVINTCHGGFSISPECALECYRRGMKELAAPVEAYFERDKKRIKRALSEWKKRKLGNKSYVYVFTPDEKFILSTMPQNRTNPILVQVVEEMSHAANGDFSELTIVDWPNTIPYIIDEYDGYESVEIDTSEFKEWVMLAETNSGMKELMDKCRVFYQIAKKGEK